METHQIKKLETTNATTPKATVDEIPDEEPQQIGKILSTNHPSVLESDLPEPPKDFSTEQETPYNEPEITENKTENPDTSPQETRKTDASFPDQELPEDILDDELLIGYIQGESVIGIFEPQKSPLTQEHKEPR
ncbi:hypothetical protein H0H81_009810, partial [Sphagnurus paluster]